MQFKNCQEILQEKYNKCSQLSGFTYIELLISMLIMLLLFGVGFANYRDFQRRQQVESGARMVLADLRLAQESALSGRKVCPAGEVLLNYTFKLVNPMVDKDTYHIQEVCSITTTEIKRADLQGVIFNPTFSGSIKFLPIGKGTNIPAGSQVNITLQHSSSSLSTVTKTISVLSSGVIVD